MNILSSILMALALTVVIECGLSFLFRIKGLLYPVLLVNLLTNPALNLIVLWAFSRFGPGSYWPVVAPLEVAVVFAEAWLLRLMLHLPYKKILLISLCLNGASFCAGVIINGCFF